MRTLLLLTGCIFLFQFLQAQVQLGEAIEGNGVQQRLGTSIKLSGDGSKIFYSRTGRTDVKEWLNNDWQTLNHIPFEGRSGVDANRDGSIAAVANFIHGSQRRGKVEIYEYENRQWVIKGQPLEGWHDRLNFGRSISLSSDGNTIAIGTTSLDTMGLTNVGVVSIYTFDGSK